MGAEREGCEHKHSDISEVLQQHRPKVPLSGREGSKRNLKQGLLIRDFPKMRGYRLWETDLQDLIATLGTAHPGLLAMPFWDAFSVSSFQLRTQGRCTTVLLDVG